jgi:hypothetical protein
VRATRLAGRDGLPDSAAVVRKTKMARMDFARGLDTCQPAVDNVNSCCFIRFSSFSLQVFRLCSKELFAPSQNENSSRYEENVLDVSDEALIKIVWYNNNKKLSVSFFSHVADL